jgi:NADPH:quinone reductase-like Zn-dependent oxidoreductase
MKAMIQESYGPIEGLHASDIDKPAIGPDDVLIRVRAAAVHIGDVFAVQGSPVAMRMATGLLRPAYGVPGFDVAGIVESVGADVTTFRPGDEVFGMTDGATAEFARAAEAKLAPKPASLSFEEAAAITTSASAALQGLRDAGKLQPGQKVLINGASGGVGTFAVQIARAMGADVTGVTSTPNVDLVRSLGADRVIDYTTTDFTTEGATYDLIFDSIENRSLSDVRRALKPNGTLLLNSGRDAGGIRGLVKLLRPLVLSLFGPQTLRRFLSHPNAADLAVLADLVDQGKLWSVIDSTFPLPETVAALRRVEAGHARGKVVIAVAA